MSDADDLDDFELGGDALASIEDEDLFPEEIVVDGITVKDFTRTADEIAELQRVAFDKTVARYAGQLNTIDLAAAVTSELEPLTHGNQMGTLFSAAMVKLSLDIVSGNLKPKSVREATQAIDALARVREMVGGGDMDEMLSKERRQEVFAEIKMRVFRDKQPSQVESSIRDALDVMSSEVPTSPTQDVQGSESKQLPSGQVQPPAE